MNEAHPEIGNPAQDSRAFRRALGQFATGVTIVTTAHAGQRAGLTVNSFASVSLQPPLVLCSLARSSRSFALFEQASHLAINVLASDQVQLASTFAGSASDKFVGTGWRPGIGDVPLLDGVAATLECRVAQRMDGGDHMIYLCEVLQFARYAHPLLLYANGRFGLAVDYPAEREPGSLQSPATDGDTGDTGDTMLGLLWDAFSRMSEEFQADRDAEGLSIDEGRVLSHIERYPGASPEFIARHSFLGALVTEDAVAVLSGAGLITPMPNGTHAVTEAGRQRVESLRQRAALFEARQLEAVAPEDLQVTRRVLRQIGRAATGAAGDPKNH